MNRSAGQAYQKRFVVGQLAYGGCADDAEKVINKQHLVSGDTAWAGGATKGYSHRGATIAVFTIVTQRHRRDRGRNYWGNQPPKIPTCSADPKFHKIVRNTSEV